MEGGDELKKIVERPVDVFEAFNRAKTGPKLSEKEWDFKTIPQTASALKKKYALKFKEKEVVPTDKETIDSLFLAGMEMLVQTGVYCINTGRVIKITEEEVKEAIKKAPDKLVIGEGRDAVDMVPRSSQDCRWPVVQGGPTGAPVSEEVFLPMIQSYAQEAIVDVIVSGVLNTVEGNEPFPKSPWEIKGTRMEVALVREACHKVGRPGMGL
jgi:methylamine--corrinoid protein Co-methyltransferase